MKIGLYVPHDPHVFQPIEWKHLVLNLACLGAQEMKKELEKHGRDMRMKVHIVYSHTDMPQGIFLCTLNLLLCHSSVMGICCPGQYMKKQSSIAIYMLSIKSETAWKRRTGVMVGCTVACRFIANAGRVKQEAERFIYQLQHWWFFSHPMWLYANVRQGACMNVCVTGWTRLVRKNLLKKLTFGCLEVYLKWAGTVDVSD